MAYQRRENPEFSWSHSRDQLFRRCQRAYLWHYYLSHGGWERDADEETKRAYALKQMSSLAMAVGSAVHDAAAEIARTIADGREPPAPEALHERAVSELNRMWVASRDREGFLQNPKRHPMLIEQWRGEDGARAGARGLPEKLELCIHNLRNLPVWDEVRRCDPAAILILDPLEPIEHQGTTIYGAPDLVYRPPSHDAWTVIDWKSGKMDGIEHQLAVYGLYLREQLGHEPPFSGRGIGLETAEVREIEITRGHIRGAERRIRESIWAMRGGLVDLDVERNAARGPEFFPLTPTPEICAWCPFLEVCEPDLAEAEYEGPF